MSPLSTLFGILFLAVLAVEGALAANCEANIASYDYVIPSNGDCAEICHEIAYICHGYTCACYAAQNGVCALSLKRTLPMKYAFCRPFEIRSVDPKNEATPLLNIASFDPKHFSLLWWPWRRSESPSPSPTPSPSPSPVPPPPVEATGPAMEEFEDLDSLVHLESLISGMKESEVTDVHPEKQTTETAKARIDSKDIDFIHDVLHFFLSDDDDDILSDWPFDDDTLHSE